MSIALKRAYDEPESGDGYRVLVDKLWPRGVSKEQLEVDEWLKEVAPSDELRKAFHADQLSWDEFRKDYLAELKDHREELKPLAERAQKQKVTLVFSASDTEHNNAVVVQQYLKMLT